MISPQRYYTSKSIVSQVIFQLRRSDIVVSDSDIKAYGFSDILFALKLAKRISLGASRISLQSNKTRRRRIKLPNFLMRSWAKQSFLRKSGIFMPSASFVHRNVISGLGDTLVRGTNDLVRGAIFFHAVSTPARNSRNREKGCVHLDRNVKHTVNKT